MKKEGKNKEEKIVEVTVIDTINHILLGELRSIIYDHLGSAYIKFVNIAIGIEYLGACLDEHEFDKAKESESRFNDALKKLFTKKYAKYAKKGSDIYFYEDFRCAFIHQLRPSRRIVVTHRAESKNEKTKHLEPIKSGQLVLVLEDFYDDLEDAARRLIGKFENGKITNKKGHKHFISYVSIGDKSMS